MPDMPDLAALIGSRICHDLISPIGAIGNGVELLMMDGTPQSPELALIAESAGHANARIRFFRVAFGAATPDQRIARAEILSILSEATHGGRLRIDWEGGPDLARQRARLLFLLVQCLESAMPYGGRIAVSEDGEGAGLTGTAAKLRLHRPLWSALEGGPCPDDLGAAEVHFALAAAELARQGRRLALAIDEGGIRMTL